MSLSKKIDFAVVFRVKNANPNGDPLNGNRPRTTYEGFGEVSDVCLKRKIRNRLMEDGLPIFVQSDDNRVDEFTSLKQRAEAVLKNMKDVKATVDLACKTWFDVRAFGQVFAYSAGKGGKSDESGKGVSIPVRGPVSVHSAFSLKPVSCSSIQITKSVSGEKKGKSKSRDTMGMKHRVDSAHYLFFGAMNPQLATKTGFSDEDAAAVKSVLPRLFENDASTARPEGSMEVVKVVWWEHGTKIGQASSAKIHRSLRVTAGDDGEAVLEFEDVGVPAPEVMDGR